MVFGNIGNLGNFANLGNLGNLGGIARMGLMMTPYGQAAMAGLGFLQMMNRPDGSALGPFGQEMQGRLGDNPWMSDAIAGDSLGKVLAQDPFGWATNQLKLGIGQQLDAMGDARRWQGDAQTSGILEKLAQVAYGEANPFDSVGQSLSEGGLRGLMGQVNRLLESGKLNPSEQMAVAGAVGILGERIARGPGQDGNPGAGFPTLPGFGWGPSPFGG